MKIELSKCQGAPSISIGKLEALTRYALRIGHRNPQHRVSKSLTVEVLLVRSQTIRKLNRNFRKKNKATDVLSFPSALPDLLGSIVIDVDTARKQSKEFKHSLRREIFELFAHGLFHLMGYDHETTNEARVMKALELKTEKKIADLL